MLLHFLLFVVIQIFRAEGQPAICPYATDVCSFVTSIQFCLRQGFRVMDSTYTTRTHRDQCFAFVFVHIFHTGPAVLV